MYLNANFEYGDKKGTVTWTFWFTPWHWRLLWYFSWTYIEVVIGPFTIRGHEQPWPREGDLY
jgi:hypothetical protein